VLILVLFALSGTVLSTLIWYFGCLVLAPVQQRDEARKEILGLQTPGKSILLAKLLCKGYISEGAISTENGHLPRISAS
jgi:hypothetical protein